MCCIITHDSGAQIPLLASFTNAMFSNRDGCGLAYATSHDVVRIRKWVANPEPQEVYDVITGLGDSVPWVFHARFATHGAVDAANTHPYQLRQTAALAHNGIIHGYGSLKVSDTRDFIKRHGLGKLTTADWHDRDRLASIGKLIPGSKFAVLNAECPTISLVNAHLGETIHDGCWTSNSQGLPDYQPWDNWEYGHWEEVNAAPSHSRFDDTDWETYRFVRDQGCGPREYSVWRAMRDDDKADAISMAWELSPMAAWLQDHGYDTQ